MEAIFLKTVNMSITASWLVLAIVVVRLIFRKTPKWILCLLWGLVAVRLIFPFSIESKLSLITDTEPVSQNAVYTHERAQQAGGEILDSEGNVLVERHPPAANGDILDSEGNVILEIKEGIVHTPESSQARFWHYYFSRLWLIGIGVMLTYAALSYHLLKRKIVTAIPIRKGIKQSEYVDSPFVLGIIRPVIYLPFHMAEGDMAYVIAHEKAHIQRKDHWWKPVGFLLLSIYWFNPVMWLAYILLCRDIEAACDEKVIRNLDRDSRRAYSTALLNCSIRRRAIAACPLAFGEVGVKERIKGVMNYKKPAFWFILVSLLLVVIVSVCFLTDPESAAPVTMGLDYVSRTRADLRFYEEEKLSGEEYRIPEEYSLEKQAGGIWQPLPLLTEKLPSAQVNGVSAEEGDHTAWSLLNWEECYGHLEDGTYRIRKDITVNGESKAVYAEFSVGGNAEAVLRYTLEEITSTGARLYEEELSEADVELIYNGNEGIWLESLQDGQWVYPEPTGFIEPPFRQERHYIHQYVFTDEYTKLDWSSLYGALPYGRYRIAREVTCMSDSEPRVCTVYAEFTTPSVVTWFDINSSAEGGMSGRNSHPILPGTQNVTLQHGSHENIQLSSGSGAKFETVISGQMIRNVYLTDLTGDGISEICATLSMADGLCVQVYDYAEKKLYEFHSEKPYQYELTVLADRLCVLGGTVLWNGSTQEYGQLALDESRGLTIRELDPEVKPLTEALVCVDIWTRKRVCLTSGDQLEELLLLLQNLKKEILPAPKEMLEQAKADDFDTSFLVFNYKLGTKTFCFSKDFQIVWEYGMEEGYLISNPEPLRQYVASLTDGVVRNEISGEPFATADTPWDWCANIGQSAVRTAQLHVCLSAHSGGSTSTNGVISYSLLQELTDVLNQIPKNAFAQGQTVSKTSYHRLFADQTSENTAFSIIDGVNNLGVILKYRNGNVTMLLTDELDKVKMDELSYLEPTLQWNVQNEQLSAFMESVSTDPPVISYSVGAEYQWQNALAFTSGSFSMNLRLIDGWEYEYVTNAENSGIRCRPAGITDGWIYFGFWPQDYFLEEEDRYYGEGGWGDYQTITSYPSSVKSKLGVDTRHQVWSYRKIDLNQGDYVIINDGADSWFLEYEDQIEDTITLCSFSEA